jgi:hypothetical protein
MTRRLTGAVLLAHIHEAHGAQLPDSELFALRNRLAEELGERWWPTRDWEGEPNGHRQL